MAVSEAQQSPGLANPWTQMLPKVPWGIVIGDAASGEILAHNDAMASILRRPVPAFFIDFVESGSIARPDFESLREVAQSLQDVTSTSHIRIHRPDRPALSVRVRIARFTNLDSTPLFLCTVQEAKSERTRDARVGPTASFVLICDQDLIIRWADPNLAVLGIDASEQAGTSALVTVHPDDIARTTNAIRSLVEGEGTVMEITTRAIGPNSTWTPVRLRIEKLVGESPAFILRVQAPPKPGRQLGGRGLTRRELQVVGGLFDGLRSSQIASRDFVSDKTVRNQLSSAYNKLGVSGRDELLDSFDRFRA